MNISSLSNDRVVCIPANRNGIPLVPNVVLPRAIASQPSLPSKNNILHSCRTELPNSSARSVEFNGQVRGYHARTSCH